MSRANARLLFGSRVVVRRARRFVDTPSRSTLPKPYSILLGWREAAARSAFPCPDWRDDDRTASRFRRTG